MKTLKSILIAAVLLNFASCNQSDYSEMKSVEDSSSNDSSLEYVAPQTGMKDGERKFIRTADLRFKVKDVSHATGILETITYQFGGFITHTKLSSDVIQSKITAISKDSSLETTYYSVTNDMTIRIPNIRLDTTLKLIAQNIEFLNYRIIDAEDVALQILTHQLAQKRNQTGKAISSDGKTKSSIYADEYDINKKEEYDAAKIANMSLDDQVNFSTVKLSFYENNKIRRELIANEKNLDAYQPNLFRRIGDAFVNGWEIVEDFIVFVVQFWVFILFGGIFYWFYRKYWRVAKK